MLSTGISKRPIHVFQHHLTTTFCCNMVLKLTVRHTTTYFSRKSSWKADKTNWESFSGSENCPSSFVPFLQEKMHFIFNVIAPIFRDGGEKRRPQIMACLKSFRFVPGCVRSMVQVHATQELLLRPLFLEVEANFFWPSAIAFFVRRLYKSSNSESNGVIGRKQSRPQLNRG